MYTQSFSNITRNIRLFATMAILSPLVAFGAFGGIAAAATSADVVYGISTDNDHQYYHLSSTGTTQYDESTLGTYGIIDTSANKQWVLTSQWQGFSGDHANQEELVALSATGQRVSYGYYYHEATMPQYCSGTSRFFLTDNIMFVKSNSSATPKKVYSLGVTMPCSNGSINWSKGTFRIYSIEANGAHRKAISPKVSANDGEYALLGTATNGYALFTTGKRAYVVSAKGKTVLKTSTTVKSIFLSGNGKRIAYEQRGSSNAIYVADANGKHSKKVASLGSSNSVKLLGISDPGSYVLYEKYSSASATQLNIYSYRVSTKKTALIDSGYDGYRNFELIWNNRVKWVPGTSIAIYAYQDDQAKTVGITQIKASGADKTSLATFPYGTVWVIDLL